MKAIKKSHSAGRWAGEIAKNRFIHSRKRNSYRSTGCDPDYKYNHDLKLWGKDYADNQKRKRNNR